MIAKAVPKLPFIDKELTLSLYVGVLGFEITGDYGDYFILVNSGVELHFFSYPTLVPGKSDFMIYMRVDKEIELLFESLKDIDSHVGRLGSLEVKPWGQKEFPLIDSNGTLLTFGQSV